MVAGIEKRSLLIPNGEICTITEVIVQNEEMYIYMQSLRVGGADSEMLFRRS